MEKRLIDANALEKQMSERVKELAEEFGWHDHYATGYDDALTCVELAPTVDAVEVVRCKDCNHAIVNVNHIDKPLICCKTKMVGTTEEDWFCADGKRKKDGGATE